MTWNEFKIEVESKMNHMWCIDGDVKTGYIEIFGNLLDMYDIDVDLTDI